MQAHEHPDLIKGLARWLRHFKLQEPGGFVKVSHSCFGGSGYEYVSWSQTDPCSVGLLLTGFSDPQSPHLSKRSRISTHVDKVR